MKILDSLLKSGSKKYFLELSNLSDELDEISLKASFIFSKIDKLDTNIVETIEKYKNSRIKIDLAFNKNNTLLAKKAFKNWLIIDTQIDFYKNLSLVSKTHKKFITEKLHLLQELLDKSYNSYHKNEISEVKTNIKEFNNIQGELFKYIKNVEDSLKASPPDSLDSSIDLEIAFYDYVKDLEKE
ncbi:hypothetical protein [Clostridium chrysemydis]|uniref:hypothetical protein n=1 Tax=Clostridium chrysemydis TaxID=2665504 RepID=UPI0018846E98|nr:hypothetical protein [Clostridium chrysemydis]